MSSSFSVAGVAISSYAKYCYRKLTKAALTGAKKVCTIYDAVSNQITSVLYCLRMVGCYAYLPVLSKRASYRLYIERNHIV